MPLDDKAFAQKVEELKEVGHEIRYRDQLMVQEFSLSMIAAGLALRALSPQLGNVVGAGVQVFGAAFMMLLTLHLRNINEDRLAAITRKEELRAELGFGLVHQNLSGRRRWSAPRLMVWFAGAVAIAWSIWTILSISALLRPVLPTLP